MKSSSIQKVSVYNSFSNQSYKVLEKSEKNPEICSKKGKFQDFYSTF